MTKKAICAMVICLLLIAAISSFFAVRKANYLSGRDQGYLIGYSIGYTDKSNAKMQDCQKLAGYLAPYAFGCSKWKGFIIGFTEGYGDGYQGNTFS